MLIAVLPIQSFATGCISGTLIKGFSNPAVYYCGNDGKRYVFPNEKTYFTWYANFSSVVVISDGELASLPIGGNVTYKPGMKLVKITTDPRVYAVAANGALRWILTEEAARFIYGIDWAAKVDDISDAFFTNYRVGLPIASLEDYAPFVETERASDINTDRHIVAVVEPSSPAPTPAPTPTPAPVVRAGFFREAATYSFPPKIYRVRDWEMTMTPDLAFKGQQIRVILTTSDFIKRGNIVELTGNLTQLNQKVAGIGRTEDIIFRNDGAGGDERANDAWFTAQVPTDNWYDLVALTSFTARLNSGVLETVTPSNATFMVFDLTREQAVVFEADHGVGVASVDRRDAAQAFAQGVDICYAPLVNQVASVQFRNEKAYYAFETGSAYIEYGGLMNHIKATDQFFTSIHPTASEWSTCSQITAHELTHSIFTDVPKPLWAEEGLAEFTARKALNIDFRCTPTSWIDASGSEHSFVPLSQTSWRSDLDHYSTAVCAYAYIEDTYGRTAISNIYQSLRQKAGNENVASCASFNHFYTDVLVQNTGVGLLDILSSRFGIPLSEIECSGA